ncbi:alpha-ribazole phosphatase [Labilibaculum filiforme]|uniref:Alpha-ribazole phosphatase n=1 Tax=Labilibaculum filiforme TaxID=1940526 RepID=A0A2N3HRB3_9BACT|nr:alpha-ribazole phosphatase [Labilibaculum filiforme]PKQ60595.1 alpha-ribazole phosphatase [Labilibaculum filiforme]
MEIYLIRHTKVKVETGICYGQKDVDLAESYPEELETVKQRLKGINFDFIISSPLSRAKKLATDIFSDKVDVDQRLMELNFGDWEGKVWDEIKDPLFPAWMEDFVNKKCSNGESFVMLRDRVLEFWKEIKLKDCEKIAIFTHGGVIRTINAIEKNIKLEDSFNEPAADFGEVTVISIEK